jgi:hypothetical protein
LRALAALRRQIAALNEALGAAEAKVQSCSKGEPEPCGSAW